MSAIIHELKIQYIYKDYSNNVDDNYTSTLDLMGDVSPEELIVFIKLFLIKLNIFSVEAINKYIPFNLNNEKIENEEKFEQLIRRYDAFKETDIESIVNDNKNLDNFLQQISSNKNMLKEIFRLYLQDTLTE